MKIDFYLTPELLHLIKIITPDSYELIKDNPTLNSIIPLIDCFRLKNKKRLDALLVDEFTPYKKEILDAIKSLHLLDNISPSYHEYDSVLILGSTGPSHYQIWNNLIEFHKTHHIQYKNIFLLGGDRKINLAFDNMNLAYKYHKEDFNRFLTNDEILSCNDETELMKLITSTIQMPNSFNNIPIKIIHARGKEDKNGEWIQADTIDTFLKLKCEHSLSTEKPILVLSTNPYIKRQALQAQIFMPEYEIDIAVRNLPYLETFETPLKGELPTSLYMEELYWYLYTLNQFNNN